MTNAPSSRPHPTGASTGPAAATRTWGLTSAGVPGDPAGVRRTLALAGRRPGVVMWYVAWSLRTAFPTADVSRLRAAGTTPEITWEPWDPARGPDQPEYAPARIAAGAHDAYIAQWARAAAAWGHPLRIRFAHETNGTWYPWATGVNGTTAGDYVAMWRHVRAIFDAAGADQVSWVWSVNVPYPGSSPLSQSFPGDDQVDEVALDGFNWAGRLPGTSWVGFAELFGPGVAELSALSRRPISISEVGCPERAGSKAAWIADMWQTLAQWPRVRGLVWFDYDKEQDWRLTSSPAAVAAFAGGLPAYLRS